MNAQAVTATCAILTASCLVMPERFSPTRWWQDVVASRAMPHRTILAYDVTAGGTKLGRGRVLIDAGPGGSPDGFRVDVDGTNARKGDQWSMGERIREPEEGPDGAIWLLEDGRREGRGRLLKLTPRSVTSR